MEMEGNDDVNQIEESVDVIDLTHVDTSEEEEEKCEHRIRTSSNYTGMAKFTFLKNTRSSRLRIVRVGMCEKIVFSLFSDVSKQHYAELEAKSKRTYTGESRNPFFGNALFAAEVIHAGELICLYYGERMPFCKAEARIKEGGTSDYMLYVTDGVVIDGVGVGHGAAMANHSCMPNAELQHEYLPGWERAPIGLLRAIEEIEVGDEIETNYAFWVPGLDETPDLADKNAYVPCKCLRVNCVRVLRLKESGR